MEEVQLRLAGVVQDSIVDGPGLRLVVFVQGCARHCPGCHNPETWPFEGGTLYQAEDIMQMARRNPLCHGVTFSGGEPFAQAGALASLAEALRSEGYEVASYSGFTFEELAEGSALQQRLLRALDVLIDGPFLLEQRTLELPFRGSRNQRVLDVPASLSQGEAVLCPPGRWTGC